MVTSIHDLIVELMTTDWLVPDTETPASTSRPALPFLCVHHETESDRLTRELARIRQLFVPELILRLLTEGTRVGRRRQACDAQDSRHSAHNEPCLIAYAHTRVHISSFFFRAPSRPNPFCLFMFTATSDRRCA